MKRLSYYFTTLIVIVMFCLPQPTEAQYQPPDSCLKLMGWDGDTTRFSNPDSVKVDSCFDSHTYGELYAKRFFEVRFIYNVLPRGGFFPPDTIIEYNWNAIDSLYQQTKDGFKGIEQKYGQYYLVENHPELPDTTEILKRYLLIRFLNYVNNDSVSKEIKNIPYIETCYYLKNYGFTSKHDGPLYINNNLNCYPNPTSEYLYIHNQIYNHNYKIIISSITGEVLLTIEPNNDEEQKINIQGLSPGIYFLRIGNVCKKLIVYR